MIDAAVSLVGWTLVHSLWLGALIGIVTAAVLAAIPRKAARGRYAILCAALLLHLTAPFATALLLAPGASTAADTVAAFLTSARRQPDPLASGTVVPVSHANGSSVAGATPPAALSSVPANLLDEPRSIALGVAVTALGGLERALPMIVVLWLMGVAVGGVCLFGAWLALRRLIARAEPAAAVLATRVRVLGERLGVTRTVRVLVSREVDGPFTSGWWRPVVVMPLSMLSTLDPVHVDALLTHELAHIRRWDYAISVLQGVVLVLLFHHPVTWWLDRRLRVEREYCCDDLAVSTSRDRVGYLRALAELESLRLGLPSLALAANDGSLRDRSERLLGMRPSAPAPGWVAMLALAAILVAAALPNVGRLDAGTPGERLASEYTSMLPGASPAPEVRELRRPSTGDAAMPNGELIEPGQGSTVVRYPDPAAPFVERWRWALAEARRRGTSEEVVIGWRVRSAVSDGKIVISSTDGTSDAPGRPVAEIVGGPARERTGVAILLTWSGGDRGALTGVRLRGFGAPLALAGRSLVWLGAAGDGESIAHVEKMMSAATDGDLRAELGAALALHDDAGAVTRAARRVMESDPDPRVRAETIAWLGAHLGDADVLALVRRAVDDTSAAVRDEAVTVLAEGARGSGVSASLELLRTSAHADVRGEIAQRLAGGNDDVVAALLRAAFDDPSHDVRREAVDAIKETGSRAARRALREIADRHPDRRLRAEARDALDEGRDG